MNSSEKFWDSYYPTVSQDNLASFESKAGIKLPAKLREAYLQVGDAPFVFEDDNLFPYYSIPDDLSSEESYGHCLNFFSIDPEVDESYEYMLSSNRNFVEESLFPIARDGGAEILLMKIDLDDTDCCSIWHYSPSGRINGIFEPIKVSSSFEEFIESIQFMSEPED